MAGRQQPLLFLTTCSDDSKPCILCCAQCWGTYLDGACGAVAATRCGLELVFGSDTDSADVLAFRSDSADVLTFGCDTSL